MKYVLLLPKARRLIALSRSEGFSTSEDVSVRVEFETPTHVIYAVSNNTRRDVKVAVVERLL